MKIKLSPLFVLAGFALATTQIQAASLVDGSADAGKARALTCTACHGQEGNSPSPMWPNIAGQNAPYLLAQLKAFKDGSRSDPLMSSQAMMLSDEDMANLAVYFESLPGPASLHQTCKSVRQSTPLKADTGSTHFFLPSTPLSVTVIRSRWISILSRLNPFHLRIVTGRRVKSGLPQTIFD